MLIWVLSCLGVAYAIPLFSPIFDQIRNHFLQVRWQEDSKQILATLRWLKENLECGLVPQPDEWKKLQRLPAPWGPIFADSIQSLRDRGAPILPSLERMISGMEEEIALLAEARMRSSQAFSQVLLSVSILPFFALILYFLLPGLESNQEWFLSLTLACCLMGLFAFFWMMNLVEQARFGNLPAKKRGWILSSKLFFEQLIAEISGGHPPDHAWTIASITLQTRHPDLLEAWGTQIWNSAPLSPKTVNPSAPVEASIVEFGNSMRRVIQHSLLEGSGSLDRLESIQRSYWVELKMKISRELQLLPQHCLKPLFLLIFPSSLLLMFGSIVLATAGFWE